MAWIARQHTKIASAQSARKMFPQVSPSTSLVMAARPSVVGSAYALSLTAMVPNTMSRKPMVPAVASAWSTARGARLLGSSVSSASDPAVSNPYIT